MEPVLPKWQNDGIHWNSGTLFLDRSAGFCQNAKLLAIFTLLLLSRVRHLWDLDESLWGQGTVSQIRPDIDTWEWLKLIQFWRVQSLSVLVFSWFFRDFPSWVSRHPAIRSFVVTHLRMTPTESLCGEPDPVMNEDGENFSKSPIFRWEWGFIRLKPSAQVCGQAERSVQRFQWARGWKASGG